MEDAAGPARAAQIALVGTLFDDGSAQPQLGAAQRRDQTGETAADRYEIEFSL